MLADLLKYFKSEKERKKDAGEDGAKGVVAPIRSLRASAKDDRRPIEGVMEAMAEPLWCDDRQQVW